MITQATINEQREIVPKDRVTHNQSHLGVFSNKSINSYFINDDLALYMHGHILHHCIHYTVGCTQHHPKTRIWIQKINFRTAYC